MKLFNRGISILLVIILMIITPMQCFAEATTSSDLVENNHYSSAGTSSGINFLQDPFTKVDLDILLDNIENEIDTDGDGLPDIIEHILGTDENEEDSDYDQLDDYYEVENGLDPLNIDTNYDGLTDYYEVVTDDEDSEFDIDSDTDNDGEKNYLDDDNDGDSVRDGIDISPFSKGKLQDSYSFNIKTEGKATFAEIQIKPKSFGRDTLYENNQTYDWPYDTKGTIQDTDMSTNDMSLRPMLEVISDNLPSQEECEKFAIMLDNDRMYIPLNDVYDEGQKVALSGNVYIPEGVTETNFEAKLIWTLESEVDKSTDFSKVSTDIYGTKKEYASAGSDTALVDNDDLKDLVLMTVESVNGDDSFWYSVWFDIKDNGSCSKMTPLNEIPSILPNNSAGGGLAVGDLNGNDLPDLICMSVESRDGADAYVYVIGYDMDENGNVPSSNWTGLIEGLEVGHSNDGAGAALSDLDNNGIFELIFMTCDDPDGDNKICYTILWNEEDPQTSTSNDWDDCIATPGVGRSQQGAGIDVVDLDGDGNKEFIFMVVDNPEESNAFRYYVASDINNDSSSSNRGKYNEFSNMKVAPIELGNSSQGGAVKIDDFNNDGDQDMVLINIDDPSGTNEFWYYVGDGIDSNGNISSWSNKRTYSGIKGGLRDSIDIPWDVTGGVGIAAKDLDNNGMDDLILVWGYYHPYREGYTHIYTCVGWDMDDEGQVRGWSDTKELGYVVCPDSPDIQGLGVDVVDLDDDDDEELYVAILIDDKIYHQLINDVCYSSNRGLYGKHEYLDTIDLSNEKKDDFYDFNIRGLGASWAKKDDEDKYDLILSYTTTYAIETVIDESNVAYDYYAKKKILKLNEGKANSTEKIIYQELHREELYGPFSGYDDSILRSNKLIGTGLVINTLNNDDDLDLLAVNSDFSYDDFYYNILYDYKDGVEEDERNSINNAGSCFSSDNDKGLGLTLCNLDDNGNADAVAMLCEDDEFSLYVTKNIETNQVPIIKDYDDFKLIGLNVEEYQSVDSNLIYIDKNSELENAEKVMALNEVLRGHYLKQEYTIEETVDIAGKSEEEDGFEISGIKLNKYSFNHMDELIYEVSQEADELFSSGSGSSIPIIIASENNSRCVTLDACNETEVTGDQISIDLNEIDYSKTRLLQLKWYDAEKGKFNTTEKIITGINEDWDWDLDDETCVNAISLLTNWDVGELKLHKVGSTVTLPETAEWTKSYWSKLIVGGSLRLKTIVNGSRKSYKGYKFSKSILSQTNGIKNLCKYLNDFYKLSYTTNITDTKKLYDVITPKQFKNIKGKFASGPKMSKLSSLGNHIGFAVELGVAVYYGIGISSQFEEDESYGHYAGFIYGFSAGVFAAIKYAIPFMKAFKASVAGTGIGALLVAVIELSDFVTWLCCNKSWSTMMIGAIYNALVGKRPEVEVDIKQNSQNTEYEGMENGFFVDGSKVIYTGEFTTYVKDAEDDYYDDKDEIDENYIKPVIKYESNDPACKIDNDTDKSSNSWSGSKGSYTMKNIFDIENTIEFVKPAINAKVKSIQNIETKIKIDKKGGRDYFEKDTEKNSEYLYFDIMPTKLSEFREYFNFKSSYDNNDLLEDKSESKDRVKDNMLVYIDEDGDGLFINGETEITRGGEEVDSDPSKIDTDGDGVDDYVEFINDGNPRDVDTDGDGLQDDLELLLGTEIAEIDTDGDGRSDGEELDGYNIVLPLL